MEGSADGEDTGGDNNTVERERPLTADRAGGSALSPLAGEGNGITTTPRDREGVRGSVGV